MRVNGKTEAQRRIAHEADIVEGPNGTMWLTHRVFNDADILHRRASAQGVTMGDEALFGARLGDR